MVPKEVDPEALRLFEEGNWRWNSLMESFVRRARVGEHLGVISYEELDRHALVRAPQDVVTERARQDGLHWLRSQIVKPNPRA